MTIEEYESIKGTVPPCERCTVVVNDVTLPVFHPLDRPCGTIHQLMITEA